jgi:tetratricopeptide (TPR) repeat protein
MMISLLISMLLWILKQGAPNQIAERNRLKTDAQRAFAARDYALAAQLYRQLTESALIPEPTVLFNQAQAYFALNDTLHARALYTRLARSDEPGMAATALAQLGVLTCRSGDSTQALTYFEQAIRIVPTYEMARFNYELLRKLNPNTNTPPSAVSPQTASQRSTFSRSQPSSSAPTVLTEKRTDLLKRLERYQLNEQKARMLLDAMRAEEIQYIQQRRFGASVSQENPMKQTW